MSRRLKMQVIRELRSQYRGMLRLKCNTPEAARITEELRLKLHEAKLFW